MHDLNKAVLRRVIAMHFREPDRSAYFHMPANRTHINWVCLFMLAALLSNDANRRNSGSYDHG